MHVRALVAQTPVEGLDVSILHGCPGSGEVELYAVIGMVLKAR
jgi:hypothetical protein